MTINEVIELLQEIEEDYSGLSACVLFNTFYLTSADRESFLIEIGESAAIGV